MNFEKRILNFLSRYKNFEIIYSVEAKIDGISASLRYKNGKFEKRQEDVKSSSNVGGHIP